MITAKKWLFPRWTLALIMVLNLFLPVVSAYAEGESAAVTSVLKDVTAVVEQNGEEIGEDDAISSEDPITVEISKSGTIEDGEIILLKDGESVTIRGIPAGTIYKAIEKEADEGGYAASFTGASGKTTKSGWTAAFVNEEEGAQNTGDESLDNTWMVGLSASILLFLGAVGLSILFRNRKGKK